jgi:hypothetical protein
MLKWNPISIYVGPRGLYSCVDLQLDTLLEHTASIFGAKSIPHYNPEDQHLHHQQNLKSNIQLVFLSVRCFHN